MATIIVLSDGETYTTIKDCQIIWIDDVYLSTNEIEIDHMLINTPLYEDLGVLERITKFT